MKHFFLELSVEQIDILTQGFVSKFIENINKTHDRNSFKNVLEEAERDKASRLSTTRNDEIAPARKRATWD